MITLEAVIISRGDIEKIYKSSIKLTLWRAINKLESDKTLNPLYPDMKNRRLPNGRLRLADVSMYANSDGILCVKAEEGRGASLSDNDCLFGSKNWDYVVIPVGTAIPPELIITKDHYVPAKNAWHYSLSPNFDMPVEKFLRALDQLAKNAGIKTRVAKNAYNR